MSVPVAMVTNNPDTTTAVILIITLNLRRMKQDIHSFFVLPLDIIFKHFLKIVLVKVRSTLHQIDRGRSNYCWMCSHLAPSSILLIPMTVRSYTGRTVPQGSQAFRVTQRHLTRKSATEDQHKERHFLLNPAPPPTLPFENIMDFGHLIFTISIQNEKNNNIFKLHVYGKQIITLRHTCV